MERIEIQLSKTELFWRISGSVIFVIPGASLTVYIADQQSQIDPFLLKGGNLLSMLFFGATAILGIRKILDKRIGLIIDNRGITDNSAIIMIKKHFPHNHIFSYSLMIYLLYSVYYEAHTKFGS